MKLPYDRTLRKLHLLHAYVEKGLLDLQEVALSRVSDNTSADDDYVKFVESVSPAFKPMLLTKINWLGQVPKSGNLVEVPNLPCQRWFEIPITPTGIVAHCCMDGKALWPIGDINHQSILEVYR